MLVKLRNSLSAFARDKRGGLIVFMAVLAIPIVVVTGLAVDAGRGYLVKSRIGEALDAAALAGALAVNDAGFEDEVNMVFNANFPPGYLGATVTLATPVVSADNELVTLSATAEIPTTFMRVAGINMMNVGTTSEVTRRTVSLDVALSVDMSGSMAWSDGAGSTRIIGARTAATTLVDTLFGADATKPYLQMGMVPWNSKVRVLDVPDGTYNPAAIDTVPVPTFLNPVSGVNQSNVYYPDGVDVPLLSIPPANWEGCVYARYSHDGNADNDADMLLGPVTVDGVDWHAWEPVGDEGEKQDDDAAHFCMNEGVAPDDDRPSPPGPSQCRPCLDIGITPLTNTKQTIQDAIDLLDSPTGKPIGKTNIIQGLAWGYRLVSPGEPFAGALVGAQGNHVRAVILLTDGENWGDDGDSYKGVFGEYTSAGANGMDQRLRDLATYVKSQGIKIYTIQFFTSSGPLATLMQNVASEPNPPYYHFAPDSDSLSAVFEEVANHLTDLRLSK